MLPIKERMQLFDAVTAAMRVCQLHVVFNILLIVQGPIIYGLALLAWLSTRAVDVFTPFSHPPPDISLAFGARPWFELPGILGSVAVFTTLARARPRGWAPVVSAAALSLSLLQMIGWTAGSEMRLAVSELTGTERLAVICGAGLFAISMVALHAYFFVLVLRGHRALKDASFEMRASIAEVRGGRSELVRSLLMIPEAIRYARRPRITSTLMALAGVVAFMNVWRLGYAIIVIAVTPIVLLSFAEPFQDTVQIMGQDGDFLKGFGLFLAVTSLVVLLYGFLFGIYLLIRLVSRGALRQARRHMSRTLREVQALDDRRPLLFLRSFLDDQVPLTPPRVSIAAKLLDGAALDTSLDHAILNEGGHHGPTVALGSPDDTVPPYGVARGYFGHGDWQDAVMKLANDAAHIVIVLDETPGVAWEVETLHQRGHLAKTLCLISPSRVGKDGARLMQNALSTYGLTPPEGVARAFGFYLHAGRIELLITPNPAPYAYLVALRHFFRRETTD